MLTILRKTIIEFMIVDISYQSSRIDNLSVLNHR